jgi:hypothetical protein
MTIIQMALILYIFQRALCVPRKPVLDSDSDIEQ